MDQNLKIQLPEGTEVLRLGEAPELKDPTKIVIKGNFQAVGSFIDHRLDVESEGLQEIDTTKAIILCDKDNFSIYLHADPNNFFGTEIIGKAEFTKELFQFGINTNTTFKSEELIKLIKFNRQLFNNKELHSDLLKAYQAFTAKSTKDLSIESDTRGNKSAAYRKQVDTNIPTHFALNVPIFKGEPAESFPVEICIEDTDGGTLFWFESPELAELIEVRKQEMFDRELDLCQCLCVIWK